MFIIFRNTGSFDLEAPTACSSTILLTIILLTQTWQLNRFFARYPNSPDKRLNQPSDRYPNSSATLLKQPFDRYPNSSDTRLDTLLSVIPMTQNCNFPISS